ncbi:MAG: caspase family protein [Ferruginibacter sp.]|nr:caspase family protein [Ferruginibacter sp.]
MSKKPVMLFLLLCAATVLHAQTMYEFSFQYPASKPDDYQLLLIDNNDGTGKVRLRTVTSGSTDTLLVDFDVKEELSENNEACTNRLFYKMENQKIITGKSPATALPGYICFTKDTLSNLYEPLGVVDGTASCTAEPVKFSKVSNISRQSLTKEFVLGYFKVYEPFYRAQFVTNNTKALTVLEQSTKMYLLFVSNVTDPLIGPADRMGMNEAISLFGKIKDFLGISAFIYDTITGRNFNKQTVLNKINSFFRPGPNDIVIFYYAGHGFRMPKDGRPGPYIDLRDVVLDQFKRYQDNSLSTEDILVSIRKKGARLNLIISESCNDTITKTNPIVKEPAVAGKKGGFGMNWSTQNCRDLFLNAMPTTILAAAASPYQLAISNNDFGGYFSTFFRNNLELYMGYTKTNVKWEQIFAQTSQQAETKSGRTWCNDEKTVKCNRQRPFATILYGRF